MTPRWSAQGQSASIAVSMAALPLSSAIVPVGPPLFCNTPSIGLPYDPTQLESLVGQRRFPPKSLTEPTQFIAPPAPPRIVFSRNSVPACWEYVTLLKLPPSPAPPMPPASVVLLRSAVP